MESKELSTKAEPPPEDINSGNICVMTHSFFSDVILLICTKEAPEVAANNLSIKTPGTFSVAFSLYCELPCEIKKRVEQNLDNIECVKEFYNASPEHAIKLIQRETMRIPAFDIH